MGEGRMAVLDIHIEHCHLCAEFESCEEFWRLLGLATKGDVGGVKGDDE